MATRDEKHGALASACPTKDQAEVKEVTLKASTGRGEAKVQEEFKVRMPSSLNDAIALEGADQVYRRYLSALAIFYQGEKRDEMTPAGETKERKRAKYLEELGV